MTRDKLESPVGRRLAYQRALRVGWRLFFGTSVNPQGRSACGFCGRMIKQAAYTCKRHVHSCTRVPVWAHTMIDEHHMHLARRAWSKLDRGAALRHFRPVGFRCGVCCHCDSVVRGGSTELSIHLKSCQAPVRWAAEPLWCGAARRAGRVGVCVCARALCCRHGRVCSRCSLWCAGCWRWGGACGTTVRRAV